MTTITIPGMEFNGKPIPIDPDRVVASVYWFGPHLRYVLYTGRRWKKPRAEREFRMQVFYDLAGAQITAAHLTKDPAYENVRLVEVVR